MFGDDPQERPEGIRTVISTLERYNPERCETLETYLHQQCEDKFVDCAANRALLKLYQLNPDRIKDEIITNILVKAMTQFPSPQFDLAMHLLSPVHLGQISANLFTTAGATADDGGGGGNAKGGADAPEARQQRQEAISELGEAVIKLRALNQLLEGAQYSLFWATLESDDLYADLTTDISGFEDMVRARIAELVGQAYREVRADLLEQWLGLDSADEACKYVVETLGWRADPADPGLVCVPPNVENEARKAEVREDVNIDTFARVVKRAWDEVA